MMSTPLRYCFFECIGFNKFCLKTFSYVCSNLIKLVWTIITMIYFQCIKKMFWKVMFMKLLYIKMCSWFYFYFLFSITFLCIFFFFIHIKMFSYPKQKLRQKFLTGTLSKKFCILFIGKRWGNMFLSAFFRKNNERSKSTKPCRIHKACNKRFQIFFLAFSHRVKWGASLFFGKETSFVKIWSRYIKSKYIVKRNIL